MKNQLMKKTIALVILIIFFTASIASAIQVTLTQAPTPYVHNNRYEHIQVTLSANTLTCYLQISEKDLLFDTFMNYDIIEIKDYEIDAKPGKPMLPMKNLRIALPSDRKATGIQVRDITTQPLTGAYTLLPAQPPQKINSLRNSTSFSILDANVYSSPQPYPSEPVQLTGHCDLAGQAMVDIAFYPLIYHSLKRQVTLITSITFTVEFAEEYTCGDYLSKSISDQGKEQYQQMVQSMVINPQHVTLRSAPHPQSKGVPAGDYDYVIITQESWVSYFQPLCDWKTKKGIPATIVTTSWIYNNGGYSGTNVEKIQAFVQDAQTNWGTMYFLLGGDTDTIPNSTRMFSSVDPDPIPNDTYYADYDNDWVCEVHVGRASVTGPGSGSGQIGNFINKILTYEKNPPLTSYATNAGFYGFDLDSSTHAEQCKINIKNSYIPTSWTVTTVYDSHGGNHKTNVIAAINAGQNLMNHADHSNYNYMGTGYVNHDLGLNNGDMDGLTNGNKQSIFYSMGCLPAAYDVSNCIAEHFVRDSNGGGVAFLGNSRYGWYNPGYYNTLSMKYDTYFFKSLFPENNYKLGACFSDHKNDAYQYDYYGVYKYIFTELTLLGDPELPIWKENPVNLTTSHPDQIPVSSSSSFTVSVTSNGSPVNQAYVCLWKGTEIYETGLTNSAGTITFLVTPNSTGTLYVTTTKQNYLPFESSAQVLGTNQPPDIPHTPLPVDLAENVSIIEDLSWIGGDPDQNDTVTYDVFFGTTTPPPKVTSNQSATLYDPGTLNYQTTYYWRIISWDNHGASTTGPLWQFTTIENNPPLFGASIPTNGSINQPISLTWSIPINDSEGDMITWSIECSNGQNTSGTGASNGTRSLPLSGLAYLTTYTVWVNATDPTGSGLYTKSWYMFTTKESLPPMIGTPTPANGSINQPLSFTWNIPISDPEGDLFSWTIQCENQSMSGEDASNGTKSLPLSGLAYARTYIIWVNTTDPSGSGQYTRAWYTFTTQQQGNSAPNKPEKPTGIINGNSNTIYPYTTSTTDQDGDVVYYLWDWGDGTQSTWLGPYTSGESMNATHSWAKKGSYSIKVKAKDTFDAESDWSYPLTVTMPYSYNHPIVRFLQKIFDRFPNAFPILRYILR